VQANRHSLAQTLAATGNEALLDARYRPYPYLHAEMGAAFAAADLAVCRAGASTLGELPAYGLPAILVPYPHAWRYQYVNAEYLARHDAAQILVDQELGTRLLPLVLELIQDPQRLGRMRQAMRSLAQPGAARSIAGLLRALARQQHQMASDRGILP
jgi:UDP-N-acetylglucosamine--N-acetylmuramyl-(pentapeptide) pyrophosphoryl-undecaprenol N-acetylglucosamine transferase